MPILDKDLSLGDMGSLIRATNLWGYDEFVRQLGGEPEPLLQRFHIPAASKRSDESFVAYRSTAMLLEASAEKLNCSDFGLRLATWQGLEILGPIAVIARNADTVLEAFQLIARYLYIHSPALSLRLLSPANASVLKFDYRITELSPVQIPQSYELSMANGMHMLRLLAGPDFKPQRVFFLHQQMGTDEAYEQAFGCKPLFGQDICGWEMLGNDGHKVIDHADSQTCRLVTAYLESQYAPNTRALSVRVSELIRRLLPTGQCNAETISEQLAIHPRTLQRRLAEEGERYETLLDQERRASAERYLVQQGLHLSQITGLLGYANQSAFNRSCRRWFGMTPKQYQTKFGSGL